MITITTTNIYSKLVSDDLELLTHIESKMSFRDPNAIYSEVYNTFTHDGKRIWDGTIKFFNIKNGVFLTGHLPFIIDILKRQKVQYTVMNRGPIPSFKSKLVTKVGKYTLRDYQIEGVQQALDKHRGIFYHSTGAGKTIMALGIIESLSVNTLFLVDRLELLKQAFNVFKSASKEVGVISSTEFEPRNITIGMQKTIYARLKNKLSRDYIKEYLNSVQCVVADECHKVSSKTWREVLKSTPNAYFRFGLSGTPLLEDKIRNMYTIGYVGRIIHQMNTKTLVDTNYLAKPTINIIPLSNMKISDAYDYDQIYKEGIVLNAERNEKIVNIIQQYKDLDKSILVVVKHLEHGRLIQQALTSNSSYFFVSGDSSKEERLFVYNKFSSKDLPIVISSMIYKEGVDIPAIDILIYAAGEKAPVTILQVLGRGLRRREDKDTLQYYDFFDTANYHLKRHAKKRLELYESQGLPVTKLRDTLL